MTNHICDILSLLRIHTAGFEGFIFLLGPMLAESSVPLPTGLLLWTLGVLINGYIFALNDLVDLPRDRLNPARQDSVLVAGRVSEQLALALSVVLPLVAVLLVTAADWGPGPQSVFVLLVLLAAIVNVYQKATRRPLLMDLLFALTMAGPLPVATWALTGSVSPIVWLGVVTLFLLSLELNSVAGNLKDLRSDLQTGFTTVATSSGAVLSPDGTLRPSRAYRRYVVSLHAAVTAAALATVAVAVVTRPLFVVVGVVAGAVALSAWGARDLKLLLTGRRPPSSRGRERYFAAGFALLLVAAAARAPGWTFPAAVAALAAWEMAFRSRLPRRLRSPFRWR